MLKRPHTAIVALSVLVFLASVSFADLNHAHFLAADFPTEHRLHSHDCGPAEIHKNLPPAFHCVTGCRSWGSSYTAEFDSFHPYLPIQLLQWNEHQEYSRSIVFLSESKRGPPPCVVA